MRKEKKNTAGLNSSETWNAVLRAPQPVSFCLEKIESKTQAMFVPLTPGVCYFCSTPSRIMKVDWLLGFPFSLPLSFPFSGSLAFLAQTCCAWALICQAVINSKKNPFLLNYFGNVMQTCLNDVATSSALRSGFDFRLIQVEKRNEESQASHTEVLSFILGGIFF